MLLFGALPDSLVEAAVALDANRLLRRASPEAAVTNPGMGCIGGTAEVLLLLELVGPFEPWFSVPLEPWFSVPLASVDCMLTLGALGGLVGGFTCMEEAVTPDGLRRNPPPTPPPPPPSLLGACMPR